MLRTAASTRQSSPMADTLTKCVVRCQYKCNTTSFAHLIALWRGRRYNGI
jgi:hypothetical protein